MMDIFSVVTAEPRPDHHTQLEDSRYTKMLRNTMDELTPTHNLIQENYEDYTFKDADYAVNMQKVSFLISPLDISFRSTFFWSNNRDTGWVVEAWLVRHY